MSGTGATSSVVAGGCAAGVAVKEGVSGVVALVQGRGAKSTERLLGFALGMHMVSFASYDVLGEGGKTYVDAIVFKKQISSIKGIV